MTDTDDLIERTRKLTADYRALNGELVPLMREYDAEIRTEFPKPGTYGQHIVLRNRLVELPSDTIFDLDAEGDHVNAFQFVCWSADADYGGALPFAWLMFHDAYMDDLREKVTAAQAAEANGSNERKRKRIELLTAELAQLTRETQ